MDKISKVLKKLTEKERKAIKSVLNKIKADNLENLDIKKLKKRGDIYRVRSGDIRIIFRRLDNKKISVLTVSRRNESTYKS